MCWGARELAGIWGQGGQGGGDAFGASAAALQTQMYHHALATGFSRGYLVSAGVLALAVIRVRRQDLSGTDPMPAPAGEATPPNPA